MTDPQVLIIGGGAAGIAAARVLHQAGVPYRLLEARERLGGRAYTITPPASDGAIDLGCGWLHSADRNAWVEIAQTLHFTLDKTPPPWMRPSCPIGFPIDEQQQFRQAYGAFHDRLEEIAARPQDVPAAAALDPADRWSALIGAVATFVSGAELDRISARDLHRYDDSEVNWRVIQGYGALIAAAAAPLHATLGCVVTEIDARGQRIRVETGRGALACDQVIVTVPTSCLAAEAIRFRPGLPDKLQAAAQLPLGLNEKLFLALEAAEEFEPDSRLFGKLDRVGTAAYHLRPFGRAQIECYFGGTLARELEQEGQGAFFDFAKTELVGLLGADFAARIRPLALHPWGADIFSRGAYSYAVPGHADDRARLAAPVDGRIYFAGEACSPEHFSTAHGAYETGRKAGEALVAARRR